MEYRETAFLRVIPDASFSAKKIVVNPNDGFDLGFMMSDAIVEIYYGESPATWEGPSSARVYGNLVQRNERGVGSIEQLSRVAHEKMGSPSRVRLHTVAGETYPTLLVEGEG